ncbi:membrane protein insertion efficiency factor YidD [Candidatus Nomurabacteria bacterium]|nr:membrane protein insertion efficiency factor YidD [Candidatus Nomurabacteria bacterium]MCB9820448.1 membrane protein insertion efficiency factor YidD [Candidatus Nomurabacteria bacterium]
MIKIYQFFKKILIFIGFYKPSCRFYPSCSEYCSQTFKKKKFPKSLFLCIYRILRCNPWNKGGYDPVK